MTQFILRILGTRFAFYIQHIAYCIVIWIGRCISYWPVVAYKNELRVAHSPNLSVFLLAVVAAYTSYDISSIEAWELYAVRCRCASSFNLRAVALISFLLSTSCSFHIMADKCNTAATTTAAARATKRNENNNNDIGDDQNREREAKSFDCECNEMQTFTSCDACPFTGKGFIYIVHFVRSMRGKPLGI